ncbi:hypothetical protein BJV82DRAFT_583973 [Fennellomyces sp. T-0311]|nr:hypothetical protein BJV82DRAFT_583973 [Fennellomyces sp. T-0311]
MASNAGVVFSLVVKLKDGVGAGGAPRDSQGSASADRDAGFLERNVSVDVLANMAGEGDRDLGRSRGVSERAKDEVDVEGEGSLAVGLHKLRVKHHSNLGGYTFLNPKKEYRMSSSSEHLLQTDDIPLEYELLLSIRGFHKVIHVQKRDK